MHSAAGQMKCFSLLKELLEPFGIQEYCTDRWGTYERQIPEEQHEIGKRKTQRIERKHLGLRTRIQGKRI
jgi:insertion element IS1 protein InsB